MIELTPDINEIVFIQEKGERKKFACIKIDNLIEKITFEEEKESIFRDWYTFTPLFVYKEKIKKKEFDDELKKICETLTLYMNKEYVINSLLQINGEIFNYVPDYERVRKLRKAYAV